MRIVILPSAIEDLADGFKFYEKQDAGLGGYFLDSLYSDIDALRLYAGIHLKGARLSPVTLEALSLCNLLRSTGANHPGLGRAGLSAQPNLDPATVEAALRRTTLASDRL